MSADSNELFTYMPPFALAQGMFEVESRLQQLLLQDLQQLAVGRQGWYCTERLSYEERFYNICI